MAPPKPLLADRACRVLMRDRRFTPQRAQTLIQWLESDWDPLSDIAGRTLAALGPQAFQRLFDSIPREGLPSPRAAWALSLFGSEQEKLLPAIRLWLTQSTGQVQVACALAMGDLLVQRFQQGRDVPRSDVEMCRAVMTPEVARQPAIYVHLRDLVRAEMHYRLDKTPFQAFRVNTSDGKSYDVARPDLVAVMAARVFVAFPDGRWTLLDLRQVTSLDSVHAT